MDKPVSDSIKIDEPYAMFSDWFHQRIKLGGIYPEAFALSTSGNDSRISSRIVLLKGYSAGKFTFYTNYNSQKGKQLAMNNRAAMLFYWPEMSRQIRIEGVVEKVPENESDEYFKTRPRESQAGAWASKQSSEIPSYKYLQGEYSKCLKSFSGKVIPRPPYWGGYWLTPDLFEFWEEREHRLHNRIEFRLEVNKWISARLSP